MLLFKFIEPFRHQSEVTWNKYIVIIKLREIRISTTLTQIKVNSQIAHHIPLKRKVDTIYWG